MTRVLIVSAGVGGGHVRAAQALEKAFGRFRPGAEVRHVDALDFVSLAMRTTYVRPYLEMANRLPELWGYLYERTSEKRIDSKTAKLRSILTKLQSRRLQRLVAGFAPDHVLATHFIPLDMLTGRGGTRKTAVPVSCVITDYAVHSFWLRTWVDRWFVASEECATSLRLRGLPADRVQVTGLPTDPAFADAATRAEAAPRRQGQGPLRVLLMAGGSGVGHMEDTARAILGIRPGPAGKPGGRPVRLVAVAGKSASARAALETLTPPPGARLEVRGFIDDVQEEMAQADLLVTKAGGLTVSEALVMGLPMFLLHPIPGQEEANADMLLEEGAAKKAGSLDALEHKLDRALAEPAWLLAMRERARAIRRPDAARAIVEAVAR